MLPSTFDGGFAILSREGANNHQDFRAQEENINYVSRRSLGDYLEWLQPTFDKLFFIIT